MTNFYEIQLKRMFGDSELLSADTIFSGKTMVSKIGDDLRDKVEFVTARVSIVLENKQEIRKGVYYADTRS